MDNKKKLVFGALVVALLGVGAFQFIGGSEEPAVTETAKAAQAPKLVAQTAANTIPPLGPRDPFRPGRFVGAVDQDSTPQPPQGNGGGSSAPPPKDFFTGPGDGFGPVLPNPDGLGSGGIQPNLQLTPTFGYILVGVVMGDTPAAVFADASGNQRLITLGGSIDGDSKVLAIESGKVVVKFGKDTLTLSIGGTASEK